MIFLFDIMLRININMSGRIFILLSNMNRAQWRNWGFERNYRFKERALLFLVQGLRIESWPLDYNLPQFGFTYQGYKQWTVQSRVSTTNLMEAKSDHKSNEKANSKMKKQLYKCFFFSEYERILLKENSINQFAFSSPSMYIIWHI